MAAAGSGRSWDSSCPPHATIGVHSAPCPSSDAPAPVVIVRSPLLSEGFLGDLVLEHRLGQELFQPRVLGFKLLEALGLRDIHAAKLAAPEVIAGFGESVLAAQFGYGHAGFCFAQEANDLFFGESFLHVQLLVMVDWTLKSRATQGGVDVGGIAAANVGRKGKLHRNGVDARAADGG